MGWTAGVTAGVQWGSGASLGDDWCSGRVKCLGGSEQLGCTVGERVGCMGN